MGTLLFVILAIVVLGGLFVAVSKMHEAFAANSAEAAQDVTGVGPEAGPVSQDPRPPTT